MARTKYISSCKLLPSATARSTAGFCLVHRRGSLGPITPRTTRARLLASTPRQQQQRRYQIVYIVSMATPTTKEEGGKQQTAPAEATPATATPAVNAATAADDDSEMPRSYVRVLQLPPQSPPGSPGRRSPARIDADDSNAAMVLGLVCCVIS